MFHQIKPVQVSAEEADGKLINDLDSNHPEKIYVKQKVLTGKTERNTCCHRISAILEQRARPRARLESGLILRRLPRMNQQASVWIRSNDI